MLSILFVSIAVYNIAYGLISVRLKLSHPKLYDELGSPGFIEISIRKFSNIVGFVFKGQFLKSNDLILSIFCCAFTVSLAGTICLMLYMYFTNK